MKIATYNSADLDPRDYSIVPRDYSIPQARNTILAALRYYQRAGQGEPSRRSDDIHEIATNAGNSVSLDVVAIDALCENLNTGALELVHCEVSSATDEASETGTIDRTGGTAYTVIGRYLDNGHVFVTHVQAADPTEAACDALHRLSGRYQPDDPEHRLDDVTAWELAADAKIVSIIEGHHKDHALQI